MRVDGQGVRDQHEKVEEAARGGEEDEIAAGIRSPEATAVSSQQATAIESGHARLRLQVHQSSLAIAGYQENQQAAKQVCLPQ